jgi:hypothetical protein
MTKHTTTACRPPAHTRVTKAACMHVRAHAATIVIQFLPHWRTARSSPLSEISSFFFICRRLRLAFLIQKSRHIVRIRRSMQIPFSFCRRPAGYGPIQAPQPGTLSTSMFFPEGIYHSRKLPFVRYGNWDTRSGTWRLLDPMRIDMSINFYSWMSSVLDSK